MAWEVSEWMDWRASWRSRRGGRGGACRVRPAGLGGAGALGRVPPVGRGDDAAFGRPHADPGSGAAHGAGRPPGPAARRARADSCATRTRRSVGTRPRMGRAATGTARMTGRAGACDAHGGGPADVRDGLPDGRAARTADGRRLRDTIMPTGSRGPICGSCARISGGVANGCCGTSRRTGRGTTDGRKGR